VRVEPADDKTSSYRFEVNGTTWLPFLRFDIGGPYQSLNLRTAFAALYLLSKKIPMDTRQWPDFFASFSRHTRFMGRWQILSEKPLIIADSAHNEGGLRYVLDYLQHRKAGNIHFVLGFVNDKDLDKILDMFPKNGIYYFAKANIPRGLPAAELQSGAALYGLKGKSYTSVKRAFYAAKKCMKPDDILFVGGSIFVVAEIL
jgi:dihydrofolate synthase/folylpolyglutamate synthase